MSSLQAWAAKPGKLDAWAAKEPFTASPAALLEARDAIEEPSEVMDVLLQERVWVFDDEGRRTTRYRIVWTPRNEEAVRALGATTAPWQPWTQERPMMHARVVTPAGKVFELDPATVTEKTRETADATIYTTDRELVAPLPQITVGAVIEEQFEVVGTAPLDDGGWMSWMPASRTHGAIDNLHLRVEAPADLPLRWVASGDDVPVTDKKRRGRRIIDLSETDVAEVPYPDELPPDEVRGRWLAVDSGHSWQDVARHYQGLVADRLAPDDVRDLLDADRPEASLVERVDALTARVRETVRYTGLEFNEAAIVPYAPTDVLERGYGDCKDQANVLVSLLAAAGIEAHLALVNPSPRPDILVDHPALSAFSHAVVYFPGDEPMWVDPTVPPTRAPEIPRHLGGRQALVIGVDEQPLRHIPLPEPTANRLEERRIIAFGLDEDMAEQMSLPESGVAFTATEPGLGAARLDITVDDSSSFGLGLSGDRVSTDNHRILALLPDLVLTDGERMDERVDPIALDPHRSALTLELHLPDGYLPPDLPPSEPKSWGPARFSRQDTWDREARTWTATWAVDVVSDRIEADDARALLDSYIDGVFELPFPEIRSVENDLGAQQRLLEALRATRELAEAHPDEPASGRRLALTIASYERAWEFDQRATGALIQRAELLTVGTSESPADVPTAVEVFWQWREETEILQRDSEWLEHLVSQDQRERVEAMVADHPDGSLDAGALYYCLLDRSVEACERKRRRAGKPMQNTLAQWTRVAAFLALGGHTGRAADVWTEVRTYAQDPVALDARIAMLRAPQTVSWRPATRDEDPTEATWRAMALSLGLDDVPWEDTFSPELLEVLRPDGKRVGAVMADQMERATLEQVLRLLRGTSQVDVQGGNPATHVTMRSQGNESHTFLRKGQRKEARTWMEWLAQYGDPQKSPAARSWRAFRVEGPLSDEHFELAVAAIVAPSTDVELEGAVETLAAGLPTAPEGLRPALEERTHRACIDLDRPDLCVLAGESQLSRTPGDTDLAIELARQRLLAGDVERGLADAAALAEAHPTDFNVAYGYGIVLSRAGQLAEALAQYERAKELPGARRTVNNQIAWVRLVHEGPSEALVDYALDIAKNRQSGEQAPLHTSATILADAGQVDEALQLLLRNQRELDGRTPFDVWWYITGVAAEEAGLYDHARLLYEMLPDRGDPTATRRLSERRIEAMTDR